MPDIQSRYRYLSFTEDTPYRRFIQVHSQKDDNLALSKAPMPTDKTHGSYGALLFHPKWKARRKNILARDMYKCVHCKSTRNLQVHHRQYHFIISQQQFKLPWEYPGQLLITLCESCNSKGHSKYKVPTITIQ